MAISWTLGRQLKIFIFLAVVVFAIVGGYIYYMLPAPSCTDGKLNQSEEKIDCGGECDACVGNPRVPVVVWARPFEISPGQYEAAALIENQNLTVGSRALSYTMRLFENNILVAERQGETFLNPRDKFLIFESDISTGESKPNRATITFNEIPWKVFNEERPNILVSSKIFELAPSGNGRVKVILRNQTLFPIQNVYVSVALKDAAGNIIGVSATKVDSIAGESSRDVFFTWRHPFDPAPASIDVYFRTNLTD